MALHAAGSVNRDHPLVQGLAFAFARMFRAGEGPPQLPPGWHSLRDIIKHNEAVFIASIPDRVFTHELLIGAIAGQMGSAHEAEGLDHTLVRLNQILVNQTQPYVPILAFDGELTLQVGEPFWITRRNTAASGARPAHMEREMSHWFFASG